MNANDITALNINGKESLWIDRGWRAADTDKDSGLSEAKLLGNSSTLSQGNYTDGGTDYAEVDTRNLSTFYNCRKVSGFFIHFDTRFDESSLNHSFSLIISLGNFQSPDNPTPYATTMLLNGNGSSGESCTKRSDGHSSGTSSPHSDPNQSFNTQSKANLGYPSFPPPGTTHSFSFYFHSLSVIHAYTYT